MSFHCRLCGVPLNEGRYFGRRVTTELGSDIIPDICGFCYDELEEVKQEKT